MRLPKRISVMGMAGILAGIVVGVPTASAAQNYAPKCDATASLISAADYTLGYTLICTDFTSSEVVPTGGDLNGGAWQAKAYSEGTFVKYTDGKWYRAALDVTAADEPTKPQKDDEQNDVIVWIEQTTETAAAWSATSTAATATAGSFPSGYVVSYTPSGGSKGYYQANEDAAASDVPGTSGKWTPLAGITSYAGPQPGGSKKVSVTYPGTVSGYSVITLNNQVLGFDTEPAVLTADGSGPAPQQTQYCNGSKPGYGVSCSLQSGVNVYAKKADDTYVKLTGATLAVKSGSTYTDLKDTTLYADKSATGSPSVLSTSTDFFGIGALGLPTNPGKKIFPALSGSRIKGELELQDNPCAWGNAGLRMVVTTTDGEGQVSAPIEVALEQSKYYKLARIDGEWTKQTIAKGCSFTYGPYSTQVYWNENGVQRLPKPARGTPAQTVTAS